MTILNIKLHIHRMRTATVVVTFVCPQIRWSRFTAFGMDKEKEKALLSEAQKRAEERAKEEAEKRKSQLTDIIAKLEAQYKQKDTDTGTVSKFAPKLPSQHDKGDLTTAASTQDTTAKSESRHDTPVQRQPDAQVTVRLRSAFDNSGTPFSITPTATDEESAGTVSAALDAFGADDSGFRRDSEAKRIMDEMVSNGVPRHLASGMVKEMLQKGLAPEDEKSRNKER